MHVGVMSLQSWPVAGARPASDMYRRAVELAATAEALGFESVWAWDHVYANDDGRSWTMLEPFILLTSIAEATRRVRIGHMVLCAPFRNAALTAKMAATLDVASGGRFEVGIGAGWMETEFRAYGYGFPSDADRVSTLSEHVRIIRDMLGPGRAATFDGRFASAIDAVNEPRGVQEPRVPIFVGGNGRRIRRIAARYADEINLVHLSVDAFAREADVTRQVLAEVGRDPAAFRTSVYPWEHEIRQRGAARVELIAAFARLGASRLVANLDLTGDGVGELEALAADCRATGLVPLAA